MSYADLTRALDQLVDCAAHPQDAGRTSTVLAAAVVDLERAAGCALGPAGADPLVVLQRRLGRVHRLLLAVPDRVDAARVRTYVDALACGPAAEPGCRCSDAPQGRTAPPIVATV